MAALINSYIDGILAPYAPHTHTIYGDKKISAPLGHRKQGHAVDILLAWE